MIKWQRSLNGFTLIELLVVIAITGIMVVIGTNVFISVLRSANKATISTQLQENGNTALERISRTVSNASAIVDPPAAGTNLDHIIVQNKVLDTSQPLYTRISLVTSNTANGFIGVDSNQSLAALQSPTFNPATATSITNNNAALNAIDLAVSPAPYFQVVQNAGTNTTVVIVSFTLQQSKSQTAASTRQENTGSLPFLSSFSLRSY